MNIPCDPSVYLPPIVKVAHPGWEAPKFLSLVRLLQRLQALSHQPCLSGEDALCIHCQALDALERIENEADLSLEEIKMTLDDRGQQVIFDEDEPDDSESESTVV